MRCYVVGVKRMCGTGKDSGRKYDFCRITVLSPVKALSRESFAVDGFGFESVDLDLAADALARFAEVRFPALVDLAISQEVRGRGLVSVVTGFRPAPAAAAA